jgi:hypothetical protein
MKLAEFLYLLDLFGPDLRRWPPAKAALAERLLTNSAEATQALFEAIRLDWILQSYAIRIDEAAVRRVIGRLSGFSEAPVGRLWRDLRSWGLVPLWPRASFLAAALAAGVILGVYFQQGHGASAPFPGRFTWSMFDNDPLSSWDR